jgi:hypothetical protein
MEFVASGHQFERDAVSVCGLNQFLNRRRSLRGGNHRIMNDEPSNAREAHDVRSTTEVIEVWVADDECFDHTSARSYLRKHDARSSRTDRTRTYIEDDERLVASEQVGRSVAD